MVTKFDAHSPLLLPSSVQGCSLFVLARPLPLKAARWTAMEQMPLFPAKDAVMGKALSVIFLLPVQVLKAQQLYPCIKFASLASLFVFFLDMSIVLLCKSSVDSLIALSSEFCYSPPEMLPCLACLPCQNSFLVSKLVPTKLNSCFSQRNCL